MATIATAGHKTAAFPTSALLAPFRAIGRFMITLAEASPQMRALDRLSQHSDAEACAVPTRFDDAWHGRVPRHVT